MDEISRREFLKRSAATSAAAAFLPIAARERHMNPLGLPIGSQTYPHRQRIKDGDIEFSIDQQPYVQGYLAVESLYLHLKNGNDIGGGQPVLTGPSFVDQSNIDATLPFVKNNTR